MKKLLYLVLLFGIIGCSKESKELIIEPSLLDKCLSSNLAALQNLSIENEAIDSLQLYIPEDAYLVMGMFATKEEFSKFLSDNLDAVKSTTWNQQICAEINPKIKLNPKEECLKMAKDTAIIVRSNNPNIMQDETDTIESWSEILECDKKDDFVKQEPLVIEGCLEVPEQELFEIYVDFAQDKINEEFNKIIDKKNLGFFRKEMTKEGVIMDDDTRKFFNETYKRYSEIFNREALLICNAQGIY